MSACIVSHWPAAFRARYGGDWPDTYCCVDVETTGFSREYDLITAWGHVLVEGGEVVDRLHLVLDWTAHPLVDGRWLADRLDAVRRGMAEKGKTCHYSVERMRAEGVAAARALAFVRDFTTTLRDRGVLFAAHNGFFDESMVSANLARFGVAAGFSFGDDWLDTEGIEKASQLPTTPAVRVQPGDTLRSYFRRVRGVRRTGLKSNLDHCHAKYGLAAQGADAASMHTPDGDAYCTHLLLREFGRQLADGNGGGAVVSIPQPPPPLAPPKPPPARAAAPPPAVSRRQRNSF